MNIFYLPCKTILIHRSAVLTGNCPLDSLEVAVAITRLQPPTQTHPCKLNGVFLVLIIIDDKI